MNPTVTIVVAATLPLGASPEQLLACARAYVGEHLGRVWPVACELSLAASPAAGAWPLYLVDDAGQAGALGFHDDEEGRPGGYVQVRECLRHGSAVSEVLTHELAELLCDPSGSLAVLTPRGRFAALEVCDPVERELFAVEGLPASDFVYPSWFGLAAGPQDRFDHLGRVRQPWEVLPGGYVPVCEAGRWSNVFGSLEAQESFGREDRRLHRTERRGRAKALLV